MNTCPFCTIYKDLGGILYEDDFVYAHHYSRDEEPGYLGHLMLKTKRHVPGLADLTEAEAQAVGLGMARLSKALKACTGAEKIYVEAYYEVVPHLHFHLTARYPETPQEYWRWKVGDWPDAPQGGPEEITALCEQLREYLAQIGPEAVEHKASMKGHHLMNNTPMNPQILALLHFARQQELKLVEGLSDAERQATGTPDSWVAKDFLVNIMRWKELQTQKLAAAQRGEVPPVWKEMEVIHQINSQTFTHYQSYSLQEVEAEAEQIFNAFIAQVERMSEEELNDPHHYAWQEGERLRGETLGNGLWHPCSQLTACYMQSGKRQLVLQLQEAMLESVRRAGLPDEGLGAVIYDQACFYATNGWPEKALQLLPEALRLRPTLLEWSRHDSDLDSLRADPTFQAILNDPTLLAQVPVSDLISLQDLQDSIHGENPPLVIDVRGSSEYATGHVMGAVNIPLGNLESQLLRIPQDRPVVTYCNMHHRGGSRGEQASILLCNQGYQARTLDGGYPAWKEQGFSVEVTLPA